MKHLQAFTLLELMVAMSITAMVIFVVVLAFSGWVRTQERADYLIEKTRTQEYTLTRLREAISETYIPFDPARVQTAVFEGKEMDRPNEPFDALTFPSLAHRTNRIDAKESELIDMTVFTVPDRSMEEGDQCRILKLREGGSINDRFEVEGGMVYELARNVGRFQLSYLNPEGELKQEWKLPDAGYELPCAVVVLLGMGCGEDEQVWCLLIPLYMSNNAAGCSFEEEQLREVCEVRR